MTNIISHDVGMRQVRLNPCQVKLKQILENFKTLKIPIWMEGTFGSHLHQEIHTHLDLVGKKRTFGGHLDLH